MRLLAPVVSLAVLVVGCSESEGGGGDDDASTDGGQFDASNDLGEGDGDLDEGDGDGDGDGDDGIPEGCGDGVSNPMATSEACDDGNHASGDGCSRTCTVEAGYLCPPMGGVCVPKCGDGLLFPPEACDDGDNDDGDGCSLSCTLELGWACPYPGMPCMAERCGDGLIAGDETCDDGDDIPGDGCNGDCRVERGWVCIGGACSAAQCGDGIRAGDEVCDDQGAPLGCLDDCTGAEPFYTCPKQGGTCVKNTVCGDGRLTADEACDDANALADDGCSPTCSVERGWTCPGGESCTTICGDGIVAGNEQCDDSSSAVPGCDATCNLETGYFCPEPGRPCQVARCGNGVREGLEQCDDGKLDPQGDIVPNNDLGDGCTPFCTAEPRCVNGMCESSCGDGILGGGEQCDDGNTRNNDGCSRRCEFEPGYRCETVTQAPAASVTIPVIYRDFRGVDFEIATSGGCGMRAHCCDPSLTSGCRAGHPDFERGIADGKGMVLPSLVNGKPARNGAFANSTITSNASFRDWYTDTSENMTVKDHLALESCPGAGVCTAAANANDPSRCVGGSYNGQVCDPDTYIYDDSSFFPLNGKGFNGLATTSPLYDESYDGNNFHFTSEVRYWFEFDGDEVLSFRGDDDVWVFINGKLAVDIGGIHGALTGCISLRPGQTGCEGVANSNDTNANELGLEAGKVYEVVVFQAERHTVESNYKLTLAGFFTSKTSCAPYCGDGVVTPGEKCDRGSLCTGGSENDEACGSEEAELACTMGSGICESQNSSAADQEQLAYGGCEDCKKRGGYCGDGFTDSVEFCDLGAVRNDSSYNGCNPDCTQGPHCGDGNVDAFGAEQCDNAQSNVDGVYGACGTNCKFGPRCGDGEVQADQGEECDAKPNRSPYGGCAPGCKLAPFCGDGKIQSAFGEQCDDGTDENDGRYGGCNRNCRRADYCGDSKVSHGEQCDDGNLNDWDGCDNLCKNEVILF